MGELKPVTKTCILILINYGRFKLYFLLKANIPGQKRNYNLFIKRIVSYPRFSPWDLSGNYNTKALQTKEQKPQGISWRVNPITFLTEKRRPWKNQARG